MSSDPQPVSFSAPEPEQLAPSFPGYCIESLIATGGMGAVYKAIQVSLDRPVAIKILPREISADPSFRDSFTAEAKAMARLNHPNLIGVYDFGEVDGILFIIMEFVPGQSLYHATHGQPVQSREAARLISEICAGLAHAHEHGIIHRDIKPSNILLDQQGRPKIGDFGLAHPIGRTASDGEMIFGTPHYTAPEVLARPKAVGTRADIFSVGVMLHELLTAKLPDVDTRPASSVCGCDIRFDVIVKKATHPVPEMRYRSASEIATDLAPLLRAGGETAGRTVAAPATAARAVAGGAAPRAAAANPPRALSTPVRPRPAVHRPKKNSSGVWLLLFLLLAAGAAYIYKDNILPNSSKPHPKQDSTQADSEAGDLRKKLDSISSNHKNTHTTADQFAEPEPLPRTDDYQDKKTNTAKDGGENTKTPKTKDSEETGSYKPKQDATSDSAPKTSDFDLHAFLGHARSVMREKAKPAVEAHDKALSDSLDLFVRKVKRACHRLDNNQRFPAERRAEEEVDKLRAKRNRMPSNLDANKLVGPGGWDISNDIGQAHREALDRQSAADAEFAAKLDALCEVYISGLEFHIAKLHNQGEEQGAKDLEKESELSRGNPRRFKNIILGREPNDVDPDVEKDMNEKPKFWKGTNQPNGPDKPDRPTGPTDLPPLPPM